MTHIKGGFFFKLNSVGIDINISIKKGKPKSSTLSEQQQNRMNIVERGKPLTYMYT